jgi:hypothetical protein
MGCRKGGQATDKEYGSGYFIYSRIPLPEEKRILPIRFSLLFPKKIVLPLTEQHNNISNIKWLNLDATMWHAYCGTIENKRLKNNSCP